MKKEIIKPFDLAKAKAGAKLRTKDGDPVEIFKWDARGIWPIRGMIITKDKDISASWSSEGKWRYGKSLNGNLVIVEEVEEPESKSNTDFSDLRTWKYIVDAVLTEKDGIGQYLDDPFTEEVAKKLQKRFGNIEQKPVNKIQLNKRYKCIEVPRYCTFIRGHIYIDLKMNIFVIL